MSTPTGVRTTLDGDDLGHLPEDGNTYEILEMRGQSVSADVSARA